MPRTMSTMYTTINKKIATQIQAETPIAEYIPWSQLLPDPPRAVWIDQSCRPQTLPTLRIVRPSHMSTFARIS